MTEALQRKFVRPNSVSESLKCIICSEVFTYATRLYCSHTFCRQCIQKCIKSKAKCPICRDSINKKNMGIDHIAQNIIDELQVFCPVDDCTWRGLNCQLQFHYQNKCNWRNIVQEQKQGKSHKKVKNFNFQMLKDEQVQQKKNANLIKGSLQARLQDIRRKNESQQNKQFAFPPTIKTKKSLGQTQIKKANTFDFLQNLFD